MKNFILAFCFLILNCYFSNAQWKNRYPKVDGYGHHVYLEGYELPILNSGPTDPAPSPSNDSVVFAAKGWLWIMDLQTLEATRITKSKDMDSRPNWSPNGRQIVFVRDDSADTEIVVLDLDSKEETILVDNDAIDLDPIFSKDGNSIYYASAKNGSFDLWKLDLKTMGSTIITQGGTLERLPIPTTQEDRIVYLKKWGFHMIL